MSGEQENIKEDTLIDFIDKSINKVPSYIVLKALYEEEDGDAELFKLIFGEKFVFNTSAGGWMSWEKNRWLMDSTINNIVLSGRSALIGLYRREFFALYKTIKDSKNEGASEVVKVSKNSKKELTPEEETKNELAKRIKSLQRGNRYKSVIERSANSLNGMFINGENLDNNPYLLPCANGTVNLLTGDFRESLREDWNTKISPIEWKGLMKEAKLWKKSLLEIFNNQQDVVDCFQRICGLAIIGEVREAKAIILSGRGRNGKTIVMETIKNVLGELAAPIPAEMLLEQSKNKNASAPTPDIMSLKGLRLAIASETSEGSKVDSSRIKWFTGSDSLTGRDPHAPHLITFTPSHTLFLLTNNLPHAPGNDFAFWERIINFDFKLSFLIDREPTKKNERKGDKDLFQKLKIEYSGILAWLVTGCLEWQKRGVDAPLAVRASTEDYRKKEDVVGQFIDECCLVGEQYQCTSARLYEEFSKWWQDNHSNKIPTVTFFGTQMGKIFEKKQQKGGKAVYLGVTTLNTGF